MKQFIFGLFAGVFVTFLVLWFGAVPGLKQTAYDSGFAAGSKAGTDAGMKLGIAKGVEQVRQQELQDSLRVEVQNRKARESATAQARRHKPDPEQNWHVIDGHIAAPINLEKEPDL